MCSPLRPVLLCLPGAPSFGCRLVPVSCCSFGGFSVSSSSLVVSFLGLVCFLCSLCFAALPRSYSWPLVHLSIDVAGALGSYSGTNEWRIGWLYERCMFLVSIVCWFLHWMRDTDTALLWPTKVTQDSRFASARKGRPSLALRAGSIFSLWGADCVFALIRLVVLGSPGMSSGWVLSIGCWIQLLYRLLNSTERER